MAIKNISDWLSFLNERITSYESTQNTYLAFIGVILALAVAMISINIAITPNNQNIVFLIGQWICVFVLLIAGIKVFLLWRKERTSSDLPYKKALLIRAEILNSDLTDPNDICQRCKDAKILNLLKL